MFRDRVESFTLKYSPPYVADRVQQMLVSGQTTPEDFEKEVDRWQNIMDTVTKYSLEWLGAWSMRDYMREILTFCKE